MDTNVMTNNHPRWTEFCERLEGPEGCDFREDAKGGISWKCDSTSDKPRARKILADMGMDVELSCLWFEGNGGFCDCEILFNCEKD